MANGLLSTLTLSHAQIEDSGIYICIASNGHGQTERDFHLTVQGIIIALLSHSFQLFPCYFRLIQSRSQTLVNSFHCAALFDVLEPFFLSKVWFFNDKIQHFNF